jgi:hypothetical protein
MHFTFSSDGETRNIRKKLVEKSFSKAATIKDGAGREVMKTRLTSK